MKKAYFIAATLMAVTSVYAAENNDRGTQEDRDACTPDVYRLCSAEIPDEKKIVACLMRNKKLLSPACAKVFEK